MMNRSRGLSLVELMVALAIGSLLIAGAVYVYSQSRNTQRVSETVARLQENGRYVFSVIEPDIQLAGYFGFSNSLRAACSSSTGGPGHPAIRCGKTETREHRGDWRRSLVRQQLRRQRDHDHRRNERQHRGFPLECTTDVDAAGGIRETTDVLTLRRSSGPPAVGNGAGVPGRVQLLVNRLDPNNTYMFADGLVADQPGTEGQSRADAGSGRPHLLRFERLAESGRRRTAGTARQ